VHIDSPVHQSRRASLYVRSMACTEKTNNNVNRSLRDTSKSRDFVIPRDSRHRHAGELWTFKFRFTSFHGLRPWLLVHKHCVSDARTLQNPHLPGPLDTLVFCRTSFAGVHSCAWVGLSNHPPLRAARKPWVPDFQTAVRILLLIRVAGAMYSNIQDCDEG